jgi:hypothetical protein
MKLACPVCKAETLTSPCRRCKADLSLLFALHKEREQALTRAETALREYQGSEALEQAKRAHTLKRDDRSRRVLGMAALLTGDYAEALRCARALLQEN